MSLSKQILLSLGLGTAAGLFFGEMLAPLEVIGDVFIRLLQMTVLPYVMISLMSGLGRLDYADARRLGAVFLGILSLLWVVAFGIVALMPLAFPALTSASFFSTTLVEPAPVIDFVGLYVPSNPFHSLANSVVPAVVFFSIAVGVALIGIPEKAALLQSLDSLSAALLRISQFIVHLTPIGVFAISASAAGTMSVAEFQKVQVFLISYIGLALVATFWLLPGLVSALTPLRAREVLGISKDAMITAFATGSSFVVIPLLASNSKALLEEGAPTDDKVESLVDVIIPASHNFPHTAKVLTLSFILFAGWFHDSPVPLSDYPLLFASGIASTFGSINIAIPFLLDLMQLPHDSFQLFVATSVLNARFGTLLQAMHMLALTLLGTCALTGRIQLRPRAIAVYMAISVGAIAICLGGARTLFAWTIDTTYSKGQVMERMRPILPTVPSVFHRTPPETPPLDPTLNRLEQVTERGTLRACYRTADTLPFSYSNEDHELIGFDIEMTHRLARSLDLSIEFVPVSVQFDIGQAAEPLSSGYCDIMVGGVVLSMDDVALLDYSDSYLTLTWGFVVRDHERRKFASIAQAALQDDLHVAFPRSRYFLGRAKAQLPEAEFIQISDLREFFEDDEGRFDLMVFPAEVGSAWTLRYPAFGVVALSSVGDGLPLAYALPIGEPEWKNVVDYWIELERNAHAIERLYDHWVLGRGAEETAPRWSVLRDVLGWVD
jgi:Na+/H+-dicarboxylate symporter